MSIGKEQRDKNTANKIDYAFRSGYQKQLAGGMKNLSPQRVPQRGKDIRISYASGASSADQDKYGEDW